MKKTKAFRKLLNNKQLSYICECHNALSAKIVEEAGFKALWGSSLTMSAAMGVRDNNEASWTQVIDVLELITDVTGIPLLLDGDTGYGNFNNVIRLVKKLEQRDVAAVCLEDKHFPKTNSLLAGGRQPLADIKEFCGKIKAAKDTQKDPDFSVVARIEAFIAGWGLEEVLERAYQYSGAGADALLIHSKKEDASEVMSFMDKWNTTICPIIVVPTTYYNTSTQTFQEAGISMVIWANIVLRSSITSMQQLTKKLHKEKSLVDINDDIVSVNEIFRLQGIEDFKIAEKKFLPKKQRPKAIILAASRGHELKELTQDKPKSMIKIAGHTLLDKQMATMNRAGIDQIIVVRGYKKDAIQVDNYADNDDYEVTREVYSLFLGLKKVVYPVDTIISYGDIMYKSHVLQSLNSIKSDFVLVVDPKISSRSIDLVKCSNSSSDYNIDKEPELLRAYKKENVGPQEENTIHGEWTGLWKASAEGIISLKHILKNFDSKALRSMTMVDLFNNLISQNHTVTIFYSSGNWVNVNDIIDVSKASNF